MLISFKCPCGNTDTQQTKKYGGMLGYEAVICKKCGRIHDETGIHEREAALIAAAPELLEACKAAIAALSQNKIFPADIKAAKKFLNNAIAKAEGKQGDKMLISFKCP